MIESLEHLWIQKTKKCYHYKTNIRKNRRIINKENSWIQRNQVTSLILQIKKINHRQKVDQI